MKILTYPCPPLGSNYGVNSMESTAKEQPVINKAESSSTSKPGFSTGSKHTQTQSHMKFGEMLKRALRKVLPNKEQCVGCFKQIQVSKLITAPCEHRYCYRCLNKMGCLALKDKEMFPVRCCSQEIPAKRVATTMDSRTRKIYTSRIDEHAVPPTERWYCPQLNCGEWISPRYLETRSKPKCSRCRTQICLNCRDVAHEDRECLEDPRLGELLDVARRHRWQRCYNCHALVEKNGGCSHIHCSCSADFCYNCGRRYPGCSCRGTTEAAENVAQPQDGDLDVTTVIAAMEQAEIVEAEVLEEQRLSLAIQRQ